MWTQTTPQATLRRVNDDGPGRLGAGQGRQHRRPRRVELGQLADGDLPVDARLLHAGQVIAWFLLGAPPARSTRFASFRPQDTRVERQCTARS